MNRARLATVVVYLWSALPALFAALPLSLLVGNLWGHHGGDALLWEPGGLLLLETIRLLQPSLSALSRGLPLLLLLWSVGGLLPQALTLALLVPGELTLQDRIVRAARALPTLFFVLGATLLGRVIAALICWFFLKGFSAALIGSSDPVRSLGQLPVFVLAIVLLSFVRVVHDLSATTVVNQGTNGTEALLSGLEALRDRTLAAIGAWTLRSTAGLLAVGIAALLGARWHEGTGLLVAFFAHQIGLFVQAALRVSWLKRAILLIPPPLPTVADG